MATPAHHTQIGEHWVTLTPFFGGAQQRATICNDSPKGNGIKAKQEPRTHQPKKIGRSTTKTPKKPVPVNG
jgi:hypothetical protein